MLEITSKFLSMQCWRSVSTEETPTLNSTKSLSKVLMLNSSNLWFFFLKEMTNLSKVSRIGVIPSRLCFSKVLNWLMVEKSSMSLVILLQKSSNLPKIWFGENSNCLPFGMFIRRSLVNSYCLTQATLSSMQLWSIGMSSSGGYCS